MGGVFDGIFDMFEQQSVFVVDEVEMVIEIGWFD